MKHRATVLSIFLISCCFGCQSQIKHDADSQATMVLIDTKTQETYELPITSEFPATNPDTSENTLMPALYCPVCETWYVVPPLDEVQRNPKAVRCPKDDNHLVTTGKPADHPFATAKQ